MSQSGVIRFFRTLDLLSLHHVFIVTLVLANLNSCLACKRLRMSSLKEEISQLDQPKLKSLGEIWGIPAKHLAKKNLSTQLEKFMKDEYFVKGILEKLTPLQVQIYSLIITSKTILTLGEISRKIKVQPINVEKELVVLKHLLLVYQRKNRERITSNLDKYHPLYEISKMVSTDTNRDSSKFKIFIHKEIQLKGIKNLNMKYASILRNEKELSKFASLVESFEIIEKVLKTISEKESMLIDEAFNSGGVLEINSARIILDEQKLNPEAALKKLDNLNLLKDVSYVDERFVRVLVLPVEVFEYLKKNPIFIKETSIKERVGSKVSNQFDFVLNLKKLILFISNKGLTLSQSEKIRQVDVKRSEEYLIEMDFHLFKEKSQIHQIEILLPFLKMFDLVDIKDEHIVLKSNFEAFLKWDMLKILKKVIERIPIEAEKRMVGIEVFLPLDIPFYKSADIEECIQLIQESSLVYSKVLLAQKIRDSVVLAPGFKITEFRSLYHKTKGLMHSSLFYMHLFGFLDVEYPKRSISLSELGRHYFFGEEIRSFDERGSLYVNPDATVFAMPEKLSLFGIHLLKSFSELKSFENVYTFQITKESLQEGILLGNEITDFKNFLEENSRNKIPQNIIFLIAEWTNELPIVTIEDGVVLLETPTKVLMESLMGHIKNKRIVIREISPKAVLISKSKISEVQAVAEKLEMIIKLIR